MKSIKISILFAVFFSTITSYAKESESLYYYAFDKKIEISQVSNKILVKKKSPCHGGHVVRPLAYSKGHLVCKNKEMLHRKDEAFLIYANQGLKMAENLIRT